MLKLHRTKASPFVRKVMVLAIECDLAPGIALHDVAVSPVAPDPSLNADNPVGKIPCLITEAGEALYDSRVICEYLDNLHERERMFPAFGPARWTALRRQAAADGLMDAAVNTRYETFLRPEPQRWPEWIAGQLAKVRRTLDAFEAEAPNFGAPLDIGLVAIACALGYLDFRFPDEAWREGRPQLAAWYATMAERPSMQQTAPA